MANADNARGLTPVRTGASGPYSGRGTPYYVPSSDSTAIYVGGLVKPASTASADGVMAVTGNVTTGDAVVGVVVSVEMVTRDSTIYREASTERMVLVNDDPNQIYEVQEDSDGAALAVTAVGNTADLIGLTSGSTVTGRSSIEIDSSTATASGDGSEDVLILGLAQRDDNAIGNQAKWLVRLNNHFMVDAQAGA